MSRRNVLTVAGSARPVAPVPAFVYVRSYVPPITVRLVQQLSPVAPQLLRPGPLVWQLAIAVEPEPPLLLEPPELDPDPLPLPLLPLLPLPVPCVTVKVAKAMVESVHTPG